MPVSYGRFDKITPLKHGMRTAPQPSVLILRIWQLRDERRSRVKKSQFGLSGVSWNRKMFCSRYYNNDSAGRELSFGVHWTNQRKSEPASERVVSVISLAPASSVVCRSAKIYRNIHRHLESQYGLRNQQTTAVLQGPPLHSRNFLTWGSTSGSPPLFRHRRDGAFFTSVRCIW
jgi:hypothetical protein